MILIAVSLSLIATCTILRFVPSLDDALSGPPAYMDDGSTFSI
jgi:hypothetical protein